MRTISKDKYSLELTNALREFLESKYNSDTDIGSYTEMDAIKRGIASTEYQDWSNFAEYDFVNDIHDLWTGKAMFEPEEERNYYKVSGVISNTGCALYLGLSNSELFLTTKIELAHKFTKDDLNTASINSGMSCIGLEKVD